MNGSSQPKEASARSAIASILKGGLIVVFTSLVALGAMIFLASTLTQTRIASVAVDGVSLTVWKLDAIRQSWASIQSQIELQNRALTAAEVKRGASNARRTAGEEKFRLALGRLDPLLEQFNFRLRTFDSVLAREMSGKGPAEQLGRLQSARERLKKDNPELEPFIVAIENAYKNFEPTAVEHAAAEAEGRGVEQQIKLLQAAKTGSRESLADVFKDIKSNIDEPSRARIESALYELQPTARALGRWINRLVTLQPEVLTLSLVILMGLLGSSLQVTNSFFRGSQDTRLGDYFLQLCVGAIAALVIFVVAKAGVPVVTDTSKIGGEAPINPYFVSFIAIISGLLSEQAIASVQAQGKKFFGPDTPAQPDRWVREDLTTTFAEPGLSTSGLATYMGVPEADVQSIIKGEQTAKPDQQHIIAIYLRRSLRDIFTDIAPCN